MILAGVCNQDCHFWVLVEDLLDAAVVTFPWVLLTCGAIVGFLGVTKILRVRKVVWGSKLESRLEGGVESCS